MGSRRSTTRMSDSDISYKSKKINNAKRYDSPKEQYKNHYCGVYKEALVSANKTAF